MISYENVDVLFELLEALVGHCKPTLKKNYNIRIPGSEEETNRRQGPRRVDKPRRRAGPSRATEQKRFQQEETVSI